METSTTTTDITAALLTFHEKALVIGKDSSNPAFKSGPNNGPSKYASLAHIMGGIAAPLAECGLCFVQFPDGEALTTRLMHVSGEWMQASYALKPVQNTPQASGSALTYARRYALLAVLGLGTEDDDGNAASAPAPARLAAPVPAFVSETEVLAGRAALQNTKSKIELRELWDSLRPELRRALKADSIAAAARIDAATLQATNA